MQKDLGRITFIVTSECNVRCGHCLMECTVGDGQRLNSRQILRTVEQAMRAGPSPSLVVLSGGEPTLLGEDLFEALSALSVLGVPTRMVTNASWATNPEAARMMVRQLRDSGLVELNLSIDDYHAVWVPPERVVHAWQAARGAGFGSVAVAIAEGPRSRLKSERVRLLLGDGVPVVDFGKDEYIPADEDGTVYVISRGRYSRLGRGRSLKRSVVGGLRTGLPLGNCGELIPGAAVTAGNEVAGCCGVKPQGNLVLSGRSLDETKWDEAVQALERDVLVRALRTLGPAYLWSLARDRGCGSLQLSDGYNSLCELCEQVTTNPEAVGILRGVSEEIASALSFVAGGPR